MIVTSSRFSSISCQNSGPALHLFRGENLNRWREGQVGFCWTSKRDVAAMFARGLNAFQGGVLLACHVQPEWIISGIHSHSDYHFALKDLFLQVDDEKSQGDS